jgi:serine/threonine-protein kinase HipA
MSVNGRFSEITRADLLTISDRFSIAHAKAILDQVAAALTRWKEFADEAGVPAPRRREIEKDFVPV